MLLSGAKIICQDSDFAFAVVCVVSKSKSSIAVCRKKMEIKDGHTSCTSATGHSFRSGASVPAASSESVSSPTHDSLCMLVPLPISYPVKFARSTRTLSPRNVDCRLLNPPWCSGQRLVDLLPLVWTSENASFSLSTTSECLKKA